MAWEIEVTDEFTEWWDDLLLVEQEDMASAIGFLEEKGPTLEFPYSSGIATSRHSHMRELRAQHAGNPYRILYAFDPRRCAILLIGGCKTGNDRWYDQYVPIADDLYDQHLEGLRKEGLLP